MKNVTSTIVSSILPLSFKALDENSIEIARAKDIKVQKHFPNFCPINTNRNLISRINYSFGRKIFQEYKILQ